MHRFRSDVKGAAAVEFAILGSVFVVMLIGILAFGVYFTVAHGVQQVAAEAARAAVGGLSDVERGALAEARALEVVETYPFLRRLISRSSRGPSRRTPTSSR